MKNADKSAMPVSVAIDMYGATVASGDYELGEGFTKREAIAMSAMQGMCSCYDISELDESDSRICAKYAVQHADALLKALEES